MEQEHPVEDPSGEYPVARVLRPALHAVAEAFRAGDYAISAGIPMVEPVGAKTARQIERYIADYGETIASLPEETWLTSASYWVSSQWDLFVDLWTEESGRSDMVLSARVTRDDADYKIQILSVHVP